MVQISTVMALMPRSTNLYWWYKLVLRPQQCGVLLICTGSTKNQDLNLSSTNSVCVLKVTSVVCINPSDAYQFLADSYRPYQLRNNKLAAAFDGAHGQDAQAQMGMAVLQNATAASPTALTGARGALRRGTKTSEPAGGRRADRRIREALPAQWEI